MKLKKFASGGTPLRRRSVRQAAAIVAVLALGTVFVSSSLARPSRA